MKLFYKIIIIFLVIVLSIVILFTLNITWKMPFNDIYLKIFENNFRKSMADLHPKQSTLIAEAAEVGNWADGTYCEFLVGQFRSSSLSKQELEEIYPDDFFTSGIYFMDDINNDNVLLNNPWLDWKERYLKNYRLKQNETIYLIWKSEYDYSTIGDIRCD